MLKYFISLFICKKCKCIENTALCLYWSFKNKKEALCSKCDPRINKWHNCFPKEKYDSKKYKKTDDYVEQR